MVREFNAFFIVGVVNTSVYYALYLGGLHVLHMQYVIAHFTAVAISMAVSFLLNSYITFGVKPTWKKFFLFPITQFVNIVVTFLVIFVLVEWLRMNSSIAPLAALVVTVPITFVVTGRVLKAA
ncbi:GtrA family protein [Sporosarcina thermotolerans]|uniref:GtrA family protein n=1 Tax=Sporosarcina thermotolerans TaxID=633404 RepID=A0AAW9A905_9BACL|nr:GtrA family protein [Sporosarcina thermotolerans]MDW0116835.1 GtrA family protein [Sporosarcina thermotolerans]WHT49006.1 GtrA family protein [Sporosarcina thermotolerans]